MIAMHLLKWVQYENDTQARDLELRYFRDVDGREVDLIITQKGVPMMAVECKLSDADIDKGVKYFKEHFAECDCYQVSLKGTKDYISKNAIRVCPALDLLQTRV